jgi:hypothetical protein
MFTLLEGAEGYHKYGSEFVYKQPADFMFGKLLMKGGRKRPVDQVGRFHLVSEFYPKSLEDVVPWLTDIVEDPHKVVMRFEFTKKAKKVALSSVEGSDQKPFFFRRMTEVKEVASNVVCLDIDTLPLAGLDYYDLEGQGEKVLDLLSSIMPDVFSLDCGFIAKASSSSGFSNMIKMHMFLETNRPITALESKSLFFDVNKQKPDLVDLALFSTVQLHYFSNPQFAKGVSDPYNGKSRIFYKPGKALVKLPDYIKPFQRAVITDKSPVLLEALTGTSILTDVLSHQLDILKSWDKSDQGFRTKVIASYHKGIQCSFDLGILDSLVAPIIEGKRPGMSANYIQQAKQASFNAFVSRSARVLENDVEGVKLSELTSGDHEHYLKLNEPPPANSLTFLRASLGTGKTYSIEQFIANNQIKGKFLTITNNSALVEANASRFEAGDFRSPKSRLDFVTGKCSSLSGTIHSLWRLASIAKDFDFVFIDEGDSVLNDLLYAPIISSEKKFMITNVLSDILKHSNRVIISDGDLSQESVLAYSRLAEHSRPLYKIEHYRETLKAAVAYQHISQKSLWGALQAHLSLGDKVLLVSDLSPDMLNTRKRALEWYSPEKNILTIHSNSKEDKETKDILHNTTKALQAQQIDALLCSPSITSGVDFSYFDVVFVLTLSANQPPNLRYQALRRDRAAKTIHYYFKNFKGYTTGFTNLPNFDAGWTEKSQRELAVRRERECEFYLNTFQYYLLNEGCTIEVVDDPYDDFETDKDAYLAERVAAVLRAKPDKFIREHNDAFEIKRNVCLYYDLAEEELVNDHVYRFLADRPDIKASFIHTIYKDFWDDIVKGKLKQALKKEGYKFFLLTGLEARTSDVYVKQILAFCGIKDYTTDIEKVENWYKIYLLDNEEAIPEELIAGEEQHVDV